MSPRRTNFDDIRFWDFSLAYYAQPQVAECCLQLQDSHGANVNLMLWSLWLEQCRITLTAEKLTEAKARIQKWDTDYVQVLRQLRRSMKNEFYFDNLAAAEVREHIKTAELSAEKCEQEWLETLTNRWRNSQMLNEISVGDNLEFYLQSLGIDDAKIIDYTKMLRPK